MSLFYDDDRRKGQFSDQYSLWQKIKNAADSATYDWGRMTDRITDAVDNVVDGISFFAPRWFRIGYDYIQGQLFDAETNQGNKNSVRPEP